MYRQTATDPEGIFRIFPYRDHFIKKENIFCRSAADRVCVDDTDVVYIGSIFRIFPYSDYLTLKTVEGHQTCTLPE